MITSKKTVITLMQTLGFLVVGFTSVAADVATQEPQSAPGRGIIASVSDHYKTKPSFYDFDNMPVERISFSIGRTFIMGAESTMIRWELKAGTPLPAHFHVNEQITRVTSGELTVYSQGEKYMMQPGQVMVFPPNVPHEFMAMKDTVFIEQLTPARQDFINGDFDKWAKRSLPKP